ncbi:serine/threonine-protein kinase [Streptosporangium becharense]|uniref:non-specific serine/threonine protein kinase n=1 Tax=Streptosporangium becharense TaxID=1816182 RepID=A0A7W9IDN9_9ACTN|nr:serine/threonine-protein kinase [Streptosporangium becharense]MBB5818540.1 serine/threonine-protein kinase [Streptosporangium becharense]
MNDRALIGQEMAGYHIEDIIGKGGMAVVYLAVDPRLNRRVALKILNPLLGEDERFRQRFVLESRTVASIDHPNIIPIYEADAADDGTLYIAMRYVNGPDLRRLFYDRGPMPVSQVNRIFAQVAAALDTAHAHDLVHRDVKPANILIAAHTEGDHAYLTDFGITKHRTSISGLTQTDQFIGTPRYMAPEQINKERIDGRCDQYALACVVYEALAGRLPFERDNEIALLWAHLAEPPTPLTTLRPELPLQVDGVMMRALAKSPEQRYDTCTRFVAELRDAISGSDHPYRLARPETPQKAPAERKPGRRKRKDAQTVPEPAGVAGTAAGGGAAGAATRASGAKTGRRGGKGVLVGAGAAVVAIVALVALLVTFLQGGDGWKSYPGSPAVPIAFQYPEGWTLQQQADVFVVASPRVEEFRTLFGTPVTADWATVNETIKSSPEEATGLYSQTLDTLDPRGGPQQLQETLQSSLPGTVSVFSEVVQVSVGGQPAVRLEGSITDPQRGGQLDFTGWAVELPEEPALMIYFCAPGRCDDTVANRFIRSVSFGRS